MYVDYSQLESMKDMMHRSTGLQASWLRIIGTTARSAASLSMNPMASPFFKQAARYADASATMLDRSFMDFAKPEFNLTETEIDGQKVAVTEQDTEISPFLNLKTFVRDTERQDPPVLIVAPMSGHYATLLRDTVSANLPGHSVSITDWVNPKDIPVTDGKFDLDDYTAHIETVIEHMAHVYGQRPHVIAVCQPTIPVLAATALMAGDNNPARPASLTLMGGPIDVTAAHSEVSVFPTNRKAEFDKYVEHAIQEVPAQFDGAGRHVYMAYAQLACFIAMNPERHQDAHIGIFKDLVEGSAESLARATKNMAFYDEYLAVMDMTEEFYIDTIERVFIRQELAKGQMYINSRHVDLSTITDIHVTTVEGKKDDIAPVGQTGKIHSLLTGLPEDLQFSVQIDRGHYGIFSGSQWREVIQPRVAGVIRMADFAQGIEHAPMPVGSLIQPLPARFVSEHTYFEPTGKPPKQTLALTAA